ncbi:MAG: hypothetical protein JJU32_11935 [Phormidium sp. BM_Day4_Bin.17]|nr:hypothetical protein [Phormidium sp. BM_Day4_Bin.17]UCJ10516.1 MAG: hypothetical protein JWS08_11665 [Phormidium sp. PBR-2020]
MSSVGLILAIALALVHGFISRIDVDAFIPKYRWLSFSGGVSMGYVFLDIFPELSQAQEELTHSDFWLLTYFENHVYLLALLGLTLFYGLDRWVILSRQSNRVNTNANQADITIFWIHMSGFALINLIFGYLLQDLVHSFWQCLLFFIAVALHVFIVDHSLREHHRSLYDKQGRWLLTAAILVGAILGISIPLNEALISAIWAFLAGSIILNILKQELPEAQKTCFWSFVSGATLYSALILLI